MAAPSDSGLDPARDGSSGSDDPWAQESDEELAEERAGYGGRIKDAWGGLSVGRRRFVAAGIVMAVVGTAIIVWFALAATVNKPNWRDVSFVVPDDTTVSMRFMVTKPPDMTVECLLLAQETNHGVVGRLTVVVPPSQERTTIQQATIRTTSLAVIGTVRSCHEQ